MPCDSRTGDVSPNLSDAIGKQPERDEVKWGEGERIPLETVRHHCFYRAVDLSSHLD